MAPQQRANSREKQDPSRSGLIGSRSAQGGLQRFG
jgi:hypothetical protein